MTYIQSAKVLFIVVFTLTVLLRPSFLNAHGLEPDGHQPATEVGDNTHLELDLAPTVEEETALLQRVEREGLGINPNFNAAARMSTDAGQIGQWSAVQNWPVIAVFTSVMPDGRVLVFDSVNDAPTENSQQHNFTRAMIWTPSNGAIERIDANTGWNLFCSGFATLPDGRTFIAGGNRDSLLNGINQTHTFNHFSDTWARGQQMDFARWYPSVTPLPNGEMLITGGGFATSEVRETDGQIRRLSSASASVWDNREYPWLQTAPDGRAFFIGPSNQLGYVDTSGSGSWQATGNRDNTHRNYGSYAMFDIGRVLVSGGGFESNSFSQRSARVINMNNSNSASTGSMINKRRQHNLTVLADGTVLATGGFASNQGLVDLNNSVFAAELWNPATGQWTELAEEERARQYHSTATLLPDGRVLSAGGGICGDCQQQGYIQRNAQVFSPPYLFRADGSGALASRPTIESLPSDVRYNQSITVASNQAASISKVAMVRTSSVTHSQNMEQRYLPLQFSANGNALTVQMPANANLAPPGHYMLFIIDNNGVPSVAPIIRINQSTTDPVAVTNAENYALSGNAIASGNGGNPALVIDGVTDGNFNNGSVFSSTLQNQPWLQIDLGESRDIAQITLHRRTDCCSDRLSGFHVLVSDAPLPQNLSEALATSGASDHYVEAYNGSEKRININRQGRYVRVQLSGTNQLELAELKVLGDNDTGGGTGQCGNPDVDPGTEGGVFVWKSCNGVWSLLLTGESGLGSVKASGEIRSELGFINVVAVSTEATDTLNEIGDNEIAFDLTTGNPWDDQFDFIVANNDELCMRIGNVSRNQSVFVGPNRTPAPNGPFNPVTLESCGDISNCGTPSIDAANDLSLTTWVDCSGKLHLYATGAQSGARFNGLVSNSGVITDIVANRLEATDVVQSINASEVFFELSTGGGAYDEIVLAGSGDYCISPDTISPGATVLAGSERQIMNGSFNPLTLQSCETPPGECGDPGVDASTDAGLFVWQRCDGSYRLLITGPSTVNYIGRITSSTSFNSVTPISIESSDTVSTQNNDIYFDMRSGNPWQDEISFTADNSANLCLTLLASPAGSQSFIGPNRQATIATSFDPKTGNACL